ncbi:MAG: hypothetical protein HY306_07030 [Nitrosomonadales bacterium]|nr:hypothetical protein [Nitrosomonadales bacterium]
MNITLQMFLLGLVVVGALTTGIFWTCRGQGVCSSDSMREALLWGGGFIIYAVIDYLVLMH